MGWGIPNPNQPEDSWYPSLCLLIRVPLCRTHLCTGGSCKGKCGKTWTTLTLGVL